MGNAIVAYPNAVDSTYVEVGFSGGGWETGLPLSNLRDPLLSSVARSTSTDPADTQFVVDLGALRDTRVIVIPKANVSRDGRARIRGGNAPGVYDVYDSGWLDWWPEVYPIDQLPWEHPSFWDGKITEEAARGYPMPLVHVCRTVAVCRYWLFEIDDPTNDAGFIDLHRLFMSGGWQPSVNAANGMQLGWVTRTGMEEALGGERLFDRRTPRRRFVMSFDSIPADEALVWAFELQRRQGIDGQVVLIGDPDDTVHMHRRCMLATMRDPSPLEVVEYGLFHNVPLILEEVL